VVPERWLLLRGLGRCREHWYGFEQRLGDALGIHDVICLDLPSMGEARSRHTPLSVAGIAQHLCEELGDSCRQAPGRWGVLGISLGAMVAMELSRQQPWRFSHVVLLSPSSRLSPPWQRLLPAASLQLLRIACQRDPRREEEAILELTTELSKVERTQRAGQLALASGLPRRAALAQLAAAARYRPPSPGEKRSRYLVLAGWNDRMVSVHCAERLAAHYGWPLQLSPGAGHDLALDRPEWVCDRVRGLLQGFTSP